MGEERTVLCSLAERQHCWLHHASFPSFSPLLYLNCCHWMWVSGVFPRSMEHWLKWRCFCWFFFSDLFQCRLVWWKKLNQIKNPQRGSTPPTRVAAESQTRPQVKPQRRSPLGARAQALRCSPLTGCRRGAAGTNPHASSLWAVSHKPKENGNSWFVGTISTEPFKEGAVLNRLFTWTLSVRCILQLAIFSVTSAAKKRTT